MFMKIGTHTIH